MESLQLFYTYRLHGALERLPRLYTFIRDLLHNATPENSTRPLLLDMGEACAPDVWHCTATEGRSMLLALDAMGYHAANITPMSELNRRKVQAISSIGLVDAQHVWRYDVPPLRDEGIIISAAPAPALRLSIVLAPAERAEISNNTLFLPAVAANEVGSAHIAFNEEPTLVAHRVHVMPPNTRPDATITAAIELIQDEARRIPD